MHRDTRIIRPWVGTLLLVCSLFALPAAAQGTAVLTGTVVDAASKAPVPDVVVTATSPALQGEQIVVTDASGTYRIPNLPSGMYTIRLEKESYKPYARADIQLRVDRTTRLNVEILPEALRGEEVVVVGSAPTIDVGSSSTGVNVGSEFINNIAVVRPGGKNSGTRSFESLAELAPGAHSDQYGVSVNGTTSPENQFIIDGLSVNDPAYGILGTPLTVEFVKEVNVITGGYLPEYGRATGGIMNVVTKSGSNEFHGSVFGTYTPGALEGNRKTVQIEGSVFRNDLELWNQGDFGAEVGGPILKDKLWFYAGFAPGFNRQRVDRIINARIPCTTEMMANNENLCGGTTGRLFQGDSATGFTRVNEIDRLSYFADQQTFQYIGKLTYLVNQDHNVTLSIYGAPTYSGGNNEFGIDPQDGLLEIARTTTGDFGVRAHRYDANSNDFALKYSGAFLDKRALIDVTAGWHHQNAGRLPSDGSEVGSAEGLAGRPSAFYSLPGGQITDWMDVENADRCRADITRPDGTVATNVGLCPVASWATGGPDFIDHSALDRYQAKAVGTLLATALGHHVFKAGVDYEQMVYEHTKAYSGRYRLNESSDPFADDPDSASRVFVINRMYGYLEGPDQPVIQLSQTASSTSHTIGAFAQDSWSVLDLFTLNIGFRWDQQTLVGDDGEVGLVLGNQWSPRVGLIYDFTQEGRSKIYANYARFYESVPLDLVDRQFPGERQLNATVIADPNYPGNSTIPARNNPGCDPEASGESTCLDPLNLLPVGAGSPDPTFTITGGEKSPVDPNIEPQSSDEWVVGAEYEIIADARVGANYTKRYMNRVIEDMSRDEANTYFLGNPGYGLATDFPVATRNYDAVNVYFNKTFSDLWLAQVSYTWSKLHGNYAGLFRPETGQLDPNINSTFDLSSLLDNNTGPLPGDRTHSIKAFVAKEFILTPAMGLSLGLSYRTRSGEATNFLGAHDIYGADEVFILPRGAGGRLPWRHDVDTHLGFTYRFTQSNTVTLSADVFNIFNFQQVVSKDERYTARFVNPIPEGTAGTNEQKLEQLTLSVPVGGSTTFVPATMKNLNFGNPDVYQAPRSIRFGARVTF